MRRGRDGRDEPDQPDERDGADWLLGELADDEEPVVSPPTAATPSAPPEPTPDDVPVPEPAAWSSRRERREEGDDWFSLAPAQRPAQPGTPAAPTGDRPTVADSGAAAGADEAPNENTGVPGPVTPTAPFALTWGDTPQGTDAPPTHFAPPRAARRSFTPPFDDSEPAGVRPADVPSAAAPELPSPPAAPEHPDPPIAAQPAAPAVPAVEPAAPSAAEPSAEQSAEPAAVRPGGPVDDYGAALWSALTEPDEPAAPVVQTGASVAAAGAPAAGSGASAFEAPAPVAAPEDEIDAEASDGAPDAPGMQRPRPPFPAFARARWGESAPGPAVEPVDDLLGAAADTGPSEGRFPQAEGAADGADPADANPAADPADAAEDTGAQPAFVWNLTPDPTAGDPSVTDDRPRRWAVAPAQPEPVDAEPVDAEPVDAGPVAHGPVETGPAALDPVEVQTERVEPDPAQPEPTAVFTAPAPVEPAPTATTVLPAAASQPEASVTPSAPPTQRTVAMTAAGAQPVARSPRPGGAPGGGPGAGGGPRRPGTGGSRRRTRTLLWVGGGLVVALVLVGLYFLGTQLAGDGEAATPVATPEPTAEPTPTPEPTGPQPAGVHAWDTLFGGECLDGFTTPWAEEFTVVDCAAPHAAQLVFRGELAEDAAAPFPGEAEIGSRMNLLCTAPGVIEVGAATGVNDLQVQGSYPVTEEQWAEGERTYYCFVNRAGGEPLTGSLQGPGPAA